uniref:phosphatidyl-N-methylethanolamine N-methyltransferase n=1 Tax=Lotharella globosa TaxID=91324 RepID=A0A6U2ZEX5_9EUKA|mmetsp:Transcript_6831/g.13412  ORF Transcript_6831/g.13412 Transcript_6831/m.13412 type:complete len:298 (+) Transcript_6831:52-945(+)|eukprot:CAMPEP_0167779354 /NCGR_PEP_ID=MMETSP0111_2-20121227/4761_1 /TAXON_ID=91324 /ORGANISM="Lotharella globosa, Strain CCCM811" /LENGTH=297 /DNA_ID=CAMNT_0007669757 /DNA_START=41 /DNA_END=934 /DNA_ORIENTATION=-
MAVKQTAFNDGEEKMEGKLLGGSNKPKVTCERRFQEVLQYMYPPSKLTSAYGKQDATGTKVEIPKLVMNRKLQLFMLACLVIPQFLVWNLVSSNPTPYQQVGQWLSSFQYWRDWVSSKAFWLNFAAMAIERVVYTIVWVRSKWFIRLCKSPILRNWGTPVDVVVRLFFLNKLFQFGGIFLWYYYSAPFFSVNDVTVFQWVTGLQLLIFGQILNQAIYRAIGKAGVYYGVRLGQPVPYCTGFPFNVFTAHPQYFGSVATAWGVAILMTTPAHEKAGIFGVCMSVLVQYFYMGVVEEKC